MIYRLKNKRSEKHILNKTCFSFVSFLVVMILFIPYQTRAENFDVDQQVRTATVKGKIVDTGGDPLAGATVQIKGSTRGVIADSDGNYEFADCPVGSTLVVSFIGMQTVEKLFNGESQLDFVLQFQADLLDEVEVVAFGRQKKESVLASISTVKPAELKIPDRKSVV